MPEIYVHVHVPDACSTYMYVFSNYRQLSTPVEFNLFQLLLPLGKGWYLYFSKCHKCILIMCEPSISYDDISTPPATLVI